MFLALGIENLALARLDVPMRWVWALFGVLFVVSCHRLLRRPHRHLRRPGGHARLSIPDRRRVVDGAGVPRACDQPAAGGWALISGILMTGLAFWTSGQFFIEKAYVLLVFAGIWALTQGMSTIVPRVRDSRRARRAVRESRLVWGRPAASLPPPHRAASSRRAHERFQARGRGTPVTPTSRRAAGRHRLRAHRRPAARAERRRPQDHGSDWQ